MIQLGRAPSRIDLLTSISGVPTEEAFAPKFWRQSTAFLFLSLAKAPWFATSEQLADRRILRTWSRWRSNGNYFSSLEFRPNQRRFFAFGSSAGGAVDSSV